MGKANSTFQDGSVHPSVPEGTWRLEGHEWLSVAIFMQDLLDEAIALAEEAHKLALAYLGESHDLTNLFPANVVQMRNILEAIEVI